MRENPSCITKTSLSYFPHTTFTWRWRWVDDDKKRKLKKNCQNENFEIFFVKMSWRPNKLQKGMKKKCENQHKLSNSLVKRMKMVQKIINLTTLSVLRLWKWKQKISRWDDENISWIQEKNQSPSATKLSLKIKKKSISICAKKKQWNFLFIFT